MLAKGKVIEFEFNCEVLKCPLSHVSFEVCLVCLHKVAFVCRSVIVFALMYFLFTSVIPINKNRY